MSIARNLANLIGNIEVGGGSSNRNVIINGAMNVAQRGTSSSTFTADTGDYRVCDRWAVLKSATDGAFTVSQDSSAPEGFANSLKFDCTTADTSIASGEILQLIQSIEGQNLQHFKKGTSSANPWALSFYVKGNGNATYVAELLDADNSRHVAKSFSVTSDWTRVEMTLPADTTGTLDDDNNASLQFSIWLHAGSTFTSGTLQTSWGGFNNANRVGSGTTSFFDSTARTFFITGVQLEVGQNPTEFEHEPFDTTLEKCQRYFQNNDCGTFVMQIVRDSDDIKRGTVFYPKRVRSDSPSVTLTTTTLDGATLAIDEARDTAASITMSSGSDGNVPRIHVYTVEDEL